MKKPVLILFVTMIAPFFSASINADVISLRGDEILSTSKEPIKAKVMNVEGGIERSYKQQPPMVPHAVDTYAIDLKNNGCMKCHSETTYERRRRPRLATAIIWTGMGKS